MSAAAVKAPAPAAETWCMRTCRGCTYLVPEAWERCKRCGASLADAPVRAAVAAAVAPTPAPPVPAVLTPVAPSPAEASPPRAPGSPFGAAPAPAWPPPPGAAARDLWTPAAPPPDPRTARRGGTAALVLALVAAIAAGVVAFRTLGGGDDGPAAHSYALPYLAPSGAYRAMLPCSPDVSEQSVSLGNGASVLARMALCDFDDHAVIVGDATYPPGVPVPSPDLALRGAADGAAISSNGVVANFHQVDHDGLAAADVEVEAQGAHVRMRVVVAGTSSGQPSIVMAMVGSQGGARDADFDRLVEHLSVVP